jgi:hypothetical protein
MSRKLRHNLQCKNICRNAMLFVNILSIVFIDTSGKRRIYNFYEDACENNCSLLQETSERTIRCVLESMWYNQIFATIRSFS